MCWNTNLYSKFACWNANLCCEVPSTLYYRIQICVLKCNVGLQICALKYNSVVLQICALKYNYSVCWITNLCSHLQFRIINLCSALEYKFVL